ARREVDDGGDLAAVQLFQGVMMGDLGRGLLDADGVAEVDGQLIGGLAGLGERLGLDDPADAHIDLHEVVEADLRRDSGAGHQPNSAGSTPLAWPSAPTTIFSTRSSAAFSRASLWAFSRAPPSTGPQ